MVAAKPKAGDAPVLSIVEAVQQGNRLAELKALHLRIAEAVANDQTPARDLAALSRRQLEIGAQLEALAAAAKEEAERGKAAPDQPLSTATL